MQITRINVYAYRMPLLKSHYLFGDGLRKGVLDATFICIETSNKLRGWGEGCPRSHTYLPAYGPGIRAAMDILCPRLIGMNPLAIAEINRTMDTTLPGHNYAKAPLDMACWDLLGKASNLPLYQLLGTSKAVAIPVKSTIPKSSPEEMLASIEKARVKGYKTHSVKIGSTNIAHDIARIEAISSTMNNNESLTYDVECAWQTAAALRVLNSVRTTDWVEQPCKTLRQCAEVATKVTNPIMLDECLHSFQDHLDAYTMRAAVGCKVKPNRVGGITKAKQIIDFGTSVGWQMHIEEVSGSILADTAAIHLACATPVENRLASWLGHDYLAVDPAPGQGARNIKGFTTPPDFSGIGVEPDQAILGEPVQIYGA